MIRIIVLVLSCGVLVFSGCGTEAVDEAAEEETVSEAAEPKDYTIISSSNVTLTGEELHAALIQLNQDTEIHPKVDSKLAGMILAFERGIGQEYLNQRLLSRWVDGQNVTVTVHCDPDRFDEALAAIREYGSVVDSVWTDGIIMVSIPLGAVYMLAESPAIGDIRMPVQAVY